MAHSIIIFLAPGFEEIEALAPADILRRGGEHVMLCAVASEHSDQRLLVSGAHGIRVLCDCHISDLTTHDFDLAYCPGGMPGAANLAADSRVLQILQEIHAKGGLCCAICAASIVLDAAGILSPETEYTCYPGFERQIRHGIFTDKFIQHSGNILTACGPGASLDFALEILRALGNSSLVAPLATGMQMRRK